MTREESIEFHVNNSIEEGRVFLESFHNESYTAIIKNIINDDWEYQEMKKTKKENSYFQNTGKYKKGKR